jgi:hypothetical protein
VPFRWLVRRAVCRGVNNTYGQRFSRDAGQAGATNGRTKDH